MAASPQLPRQSRRRCAMFSVECVVAARHCFRSTRRTVYSIVFRRNGLSRRPPIGRGTSRRSPAMTMMGGAGVEGGREANRHDRCAAFSPSARMTLRRPATIDERQGFCGNSRLGNLETEQIKVGDARYSSGFVGLGKENRRIAPGHVVGAPAASRHDSAVGKTPQPVDFSGSSCPRFVSCARRSSRVATDYIDILLTGLAVPLRRV